MLELYKNIKRLRKDRKWSQDELARRAGYTDRSSIAKIESGKFDLPQSKILLFADIFGVDPGVLMGNDGVLNMPSEAEMQMIEAYRMLNAVGKEKAMEYITDLLDNAKYTKDTSLKAKKAM